MNISDAQIEDIKLRTDLAELISSYGVNLRQTGSRHTACCPFHNEKTPSFSVDSNKGLYKCFGCGEAGDAIKFVQKMDGLPFIDAVKKLAERAGVKLETREDPEAGMRKRLYALIAELSEFYRRCLKKTKEAQIARDYLKSRDLGDAVQDEYRIGYAIRSAADIVKWGAKYGYSPEEIEKAGVIKAADPNKPGDRPYHRFAGRLMFTICDRQGRPVGFSGRQLVENKNSGKYVNSPETPVFRKSKVLYLFDRASGNIVRSPHREIILCEGQIDAIRLHINGFNTAVAGQGTAFTDDHAQMIKKVADSALLMYDDDSAGRKATIKVAGMLLAMEMPVRVVSLPGGDDPDSYLRSHRPEELQKLIDDAESIMSFQARAERAKEKNPESLDAVSRISRALVGTIAHCPNPILRSSMAAEAAKLLGLPVSAIAEETERAREKVASEPVRKTVQPSAEEEIEEPFDESDIGPGTDAREDEPPSALELELMAYLTASEDDRDALAEMVRDCLPESTFAHAFTRRFVREWVSSGSVEPEEGERRWMDSVLSRAATFAITGDSLQLESYVREIWTRFISARRLSLPAGNDPETQNTQMALADAYQKIRTLQWDAAKDLIEKLKKEYT